MRIGLIGGLAALVLGGLAVGCNDDSGAASASDTTLAPADTTSATTTPSESDTHTGTESDTTGDSESATRADSESATASDTGVATSESAPDVPVDTAPGPYPAGPYGVTVGATIANMHWIGYRNDAADAVSTTKPYAAYSLDDARLSGKRYAMINLAESLCPGCQKSAGEMADEGAAVNAAGGLVIEVLETTGFFAQASKGSLDAWVNKYGLPVTVVKDLDGSGTPTMDALGGREHAYIIDLATMKILKIITGDNTGLGATSGGLGMAELRRLLEL